MSDNIKDELLEDEASKLKSESKESEDPAEEQKAEESSLENEKQEEESAEDKLQKELSEQKDKYLRLMAEYDNFRKRSAKERLEAADNTVAGTLGEILPVIDNFERALGAETTDESYKSGVEMIFNQFIEVIKKLGVEIIDPLGEKFDPNIANAVNQIEDEKYGENEVAQVFQKGYKIKDKVIRYAMVVVANP